MKRVQYALKRKREHDEEKWKRGRIRDLRVELLGDVLREDDDRSVELRVRQLAEAHEYLVAVSLLLAGADRAVAIRPLRVRVRLQPHLHTSARRIVHGLALEWLATFATYGRGTLEQPGMWAIATMNLFNRFWTSVSKET